MPDCSFHGVCLDGVCECFNGYVGSDCSLAVQSNRTGCLLECSSHGPYDHDRRQCVCDPGWTGEFCEAGKMAEVDIQHPISYTKHVFISYPQRHSSGWLSLPSSHS